MYTYHWPSIDNTIDSIPLFVPLLVKDIRVQISWLMVQFYITIGGMHDNGTFLADYCVNEWICSYFSKQKEQVGVTQFHFLIEQTYFKL